MQQSSCGPLRKVSTICARLPWTSQVEHGGSCISTAARQNEPELLFYTTNISNTQSLRNHWHRNSFSPNSRFQEENIMQIISENIRLDQIHFTCRPNNTPNSEIVGRFRLTPSLTLDQSLQIFKIPDIIIPCISLPVGLTKDQKRTKKFEILQSSKKTDVENPGDHLYWT